jgi:hypothetical protein
MPIALGFHENMHSSSRVQGFHPAVRVTYPKTMTFKLLRRISKVYRSDRCNDT